VDQTESTLLPVDKTTSQRPHIAGTPFRTKNREYLLC